MEVIMKRFPITLLTASALSMGLTVPVFAVDVPERQKEAQQERQDVREEQRDVREEARQKRQDVREEQKDVQEERREAAEARKDIQRDITQAHRASKVIGMDVENAQGEDLGDIKDLVIDFDKGQIAYVVVGSGGVLGVGDTLHAVPWSSLDLSDKMDKFVINVDKNQWKNAPGFNPNDWPEVADKEFRQRIDSYYR
jgi:sporulation protein YlmC with PRC-barrel domain